MAATRLGMQSDEPMPDERSCTETFELGEYAAKSPGTTSLFLCLFKPGAFVLQCTEMVPLAGFFL
jgi:hypothetical protein